MKKENKGKGEWVVKRFGVQRAGEKIGGGENKWPSRGKEDKSREGRAGKGRGH